MRKLSIFFVFCFFAPLIFGMEIFVHKTNEKTGSSCQAVRLKDNWFMTAAHCVKPHCEYSSCEAEIPFGKTNKSNIFWLYKAKNDKTYYDIAVINFKDIKPLPAFTAPKILIIKDTEDSAPKGVNRSLSIVYSQMLAPKQLNSSGYVFYGPKNKIIFTKEFGLFHGVSGAGVFTDKNELISVVSGVTGQGENAEYSVFSVFDEKVKEFLNSHHIHGLDFTYLNNKDFYEIPEQEKDKAASLDSN